MSTALTSTAIDDHDALTGPYFNFRTHDAADLAVLRDRFVKASPFPHLVMDDFLTAPRATVTAHFPDGGWEHWRRFQDAYQHQKHTCSDIELLPAMFRLMIHELSSPAFLGFLEKITGIRGLMPDPYLMGGGLHSSGPGGILAPHADFHTYGKLALFRRINVLVYLNPDWREQDGGSLELFRKGEDRPCVSVLPVFGRVVMFLTDAQSIHGFTRPIADGQWRHSLALYYYTSEDTAGFGGDGATHWQQHGKYRGVKGAQLAASKILQRGSVALSRMAHRLDPNVKRGARPVTVR